MEWIMNDLKTFHTEKIYVVASKRSRNHFIYEKTHNTTVI